MHCIRIQIHVCPDSDPAGDQEQLKPYTVDNDVFFQKIRTFSMASTKDFRAPEKLAAIRNDRDIQLLKYVLSCIFFFLFWEPVLSDQVPFY